MEYNDVINARHSARFFSNKTVSKKKLEAILNSALLAPSAKNRQPWKFYILNTEQKTNIADLLLEWEIKNPKERTSVKGTAEQIKVADKMIMIYTEKYKSKIKQEYYKKPDYISLGCAIENMSLQATNLGLGSCILCDTLYIEEKIDKYLGISNLEQVCGFIIGYPIFNYPFKKKKNLKDALLN